MPAHENKCCPRCQEMFECKAGNITQCQCSAVKLSVEEREYMAGLFSDCVCGNCLLELKNEYMESCKGSLSKVKLHR